MYALSVIMATYNENPVFLGKCMDSVLNQTFRNFEFIIAVEPNEANINFLKNIVNTDKRIKILENETRLGVSASRNRAILKSSAKYIALIDGDDFCALDRFEKQIAFLEKNPDINIVGSNLFLIDWNNNIVGERSYPELHNDIKRYFLQTMAIANPTVMTRKKDLEEVGLFDSQFTKAEDVELWLRFLAKGKKMGNLQDKLVYHRGQANSNAKRGHMHYKNFYIARKRYSRFIWPFPQRFLSLFFYFIFANIPNFLLDILVNLNIVNRIKKIKK